MALRIEKRVGAILILTAAIAVAQPFSFPVREKHLHGGSGGTLRVSETSISFESREWKYGDIQQLSLSAERLMILTYEDRKWQLGRDREYVFDQLPEGLATQLYPLFTRILDQRFVAALADAEVHPLWKVGAKLRGAQGMLIVGENTIAFDTKTPGQSRTWRLSDIDSIGTGGLFDLSITTLEKAGWRHAGPSEFHFQLKEALHEERYNDLWRRLNQSHILAQNEHPNL
jgi:hypothetical protein